MTEPYPLIESTRIVGLIASGGDATRICTTDGECSHYLWLDREIAVKVDDFMYGKRMWIDSTMLPIGSWLVHPPLPLARAISSLEDYVEWLSERVKGLVEGKTLLLGYSGGKDSTAALIVLTKLQERLSFKLKPVYIYIPFLEPPRNIKFVETVSRRLSINIEIIEAKRRDLKTLLGWKGLPRRGYRWCTYYKVKPMRDLKKKIDKSIEVIADRLTEAPKRLERLARRAIEEQPLQGRKFNPVYPLTVLDVISIVKKYNLVHPDYYEGMPRVACLMCPYRCIHEFPKDPLRYLNDPGVVEKALKKTYEKWYSKFSTWDEFLENHLWRYPKAIAKRLINAKRSLSSIDAASSTFIDREVVAEAYKKVWLAETVEQPVLSPREVAAEILNAWRKTKPIAV